MGLFDKVMCFYYTHVEDKIEKITDPIGTAIGDALPSNEQVDKFYNKISDSACNELDKFEEKVVKAEESVEESLDFLSEKIATPWLEKQIEKADRFFENCEALLLDDPYTEGQKQGYAKAAMYYEIIYTSTKNYYDEALKILNSKIDINSNDVFALSDLLNKKRQQLEKMIHKREQKKELVAATKNVSIDELDGFTLFPKKRSLLDAISSKKVRQLRKGYFDGFISAKELYEEQLNNLIKEFEIIIQKKESLLKEYVNLYNEILEEMKKVTEQIVSLELIEDN